MSKRGVICACLLGASLVPCIALANDEKAAADRFREGRRAFAAHDYQRAAAEFEAANRAKPAAAALLSAGLAWELGGDALNAAIDLAQALAVGGLEARDIATATTHLADLDAKLGHLAVRGPSSSHVTIDSRDVGSLPLDVRVTAGTHTIEMQNVHRVTTVTAGATMTVDMTPPIESLPPPPPHTAPVQRTLGWVGLGVGAGAFIAGAIVGGVGLATRDDFVSGGGASTSLHDQAVTLRTVANVLWVSAGVFAATGIVLILTAPSSHAVTASIGLSSAKVQVAF